MKLPKILFIGSHLSQFRGTQGPSERIARLLRSDFDIRLVSHFENQLIRLLDIALNVVFCSYDTVHIDVFSNRAFFYANFASWIAKLRQKHIVMTLHGGMLTEKYESEPESLRKVFNRAFILQSPSLFLIDFFQKKEFNVRYMPNFIDLSDFPYNRDKVVSHSLLWVRAFSSEYRPELAILTLSKILPYYPDATLTMIGPDKGLQNDMELLIKNLDLVNHIRLEGKVPNQDLFTYYQTHAVYLNTTMYESFGLAVLEAASCGIPVVSTRVGEIPYLWKEGVEMLMSEADAEMMSREVMSVFESVSLAQKLSINARKKADNYDWQFVKQQWLELLQNKVAE